jgi:hypothetical protein
MVFALLSYAHAYGEKSPELYAANRTFSEESTCKLNPSMQLASVESNQSSAVH